MEIFLKTCYLNYKKNLKIRKPDKFKLKELPLLLPKTPNSSNKAKALYILFYSQKYTAQSKQVILCISLLFSSQKTSKIVLT